MNSKTITKMLIIFTVLNSSLFISCNDDKGNTIDYSDIKILDSLIRVTSISKDTLFLGFRMNMNKNEYDEHISKLVDKKTLTYSKSNEIHFFNQKIDLGAGYSYNTKISLDNYDGKTIAGYGKYVLSPIFNEDENLIQFDIIIKSEIWDEYNGGDGWLETNIKKNYPSMGDNNLKKAFIDNDIIDRTDFILQKDNLVIYETESSIRYTNLKRMFLLLFMEVAEKDIIKEETKDVIL